MAKKTKTPVYELYYFTKEHCAPCKVARPIVERVAAALPLPMTALDVRSPEGEPYISAFNLLAVPTLVLLLDGKKVTSLSGADLQSAEKLTKHLTKHLEPSR